MSIADDKFRRFPRYHMLCQPFPLVRASAMARIGVLAGSCIVADSHVFLVSPE